MLFNSYTFFCFFIVVLVAHYLPLPWSFKKKNLLLASYLFYAAWNPPFVALLWISTLTDWFIVRWIASTDSRWQRNLALGLSLLVNLGMLSFFKYGGFLLQNFVLAASWAGIQFQPVELDIILPVGISFYTFQTLSYTLDVYRGRSKPWKSFFDFALFVTFFPQLVAGPIVRANDFLPQCATPRKANARELGWGLNLILIGLFQKTVVADGLLAPIVERVYSHEVVDMLTAWIGTVAFAGQIFCDFAGYSTCAIGVAMCLGFALPDNFRFPYAAVGFSDFWQRWHISLSSWLRDYLYIPLGGNRSGQLRTIINLMVTMLIGGLWHGASWAFIIWGGLHGVYLVTERGLKATPLAGHVFWKGLPGRLTLAGITFAAVCIAWNFFRAESFEQSISFATAMIWMENSTNRVVGKLDMLIVGGTMSTMLFIHWVLRDTTLEQAVACTPAVLLVGLNAAMLVAVVMMPGEDRAFLYFQF